MVLINEWLPNPTGADAKNEWIELFNNGTGPVNLSGWHIATKTGKPAALKGTIGPGEFFVLKKGDFTFSLHNSDESLFLYDASGQLMDRSSAFGTAPEGKSLARQGSSFVFAVPTPGAQNNSAPALALIEENHPFGVPLAPKAGAAGFLEAMLGVGIALTLATLFIIKKNENLSHLFFGRN